MVTQQQMLEIRIFGGLSLFYAGEELPLPSSRKTRALAAYLLLASGRHSRQALCDLFWDSVDDPLAGLRWALSKLRPLLNAGDVERLVSDRSHAWFDPVEVHLDRERLVDISDQAEISESDAEAVWEATSGLVLDGCDLLNLPDFSAWIEGQRNEGTRLRARLARRLAKDRNLSWQTRDTWAERWTGISPFSHDAAVTAFGARHFSAGRDAAAALGSKLTRSFLDAGLEPPKLMVDPAAGKPAAPALGDSASASSRARTRSASHGRASVTRPIRRWSRRRTGSTISNSTGRPRSGARCSASCRNRIG